MGRIDKIEEAASDWVVRLQADDASHTDWDAFDAWVSQSAEHERAYDAALILSLEIESAAPQIWRVLENAPASAPAVQTEAASFFPRRARGSSRSTPRRLAPWFGAVAAGAIAATALVLVAPWQGKTTDYATGKGERRTVVLADGSRVDMNAGSHMTVRFDHDARHVTLDDAQAVFDVTKDPKRPFLIAVGDETVRVVGTRFDVRRRDGQVAVTVARGVVEVAQPTGQPFRLHPGQQLVHTEGQPRSTVQTVAAQEVLDWREGRLIYRNQPLSQVVGDLNRYYAKPIRLAGPGAASIKFSGVLIVGSQTEMIDRLTSVLPVSAASSDDAVTLTSR